MIETQSYSTHGPEAVASVPPATTTVETLNRQLFCPYCVEVFEPKRKGQKYCSRQCQKAATNHQARGSRKVADSWEEKRRQEERTGRVKGLSHAFYETPPAYRAAFLEELIAEARNNVELRDLVTARAYLRSWDRDEGTGRLHIAHVLDHYCREVYALRSFEVVENKVEFPGNGVLAFPAEYFGPDDPPIYADGSLKQRR